MTLVYIDGFEHSDITRYQQATGIDFVAGRNGNGLRVINGGGNKMRKQLPAADEHATLIVGRSHSKNGGGASDNSAWIGGGGDMGNLFAFLSDDGATVHISVQRASGNQIVVTRGAMNGTVLGSYVVNPISYTDFYYFECKCVLSDTVGSVEVRMNGNVIINLTGIDTKNGGTKTVFDSVGIGPSQTLNNVHDVVDDFYICNGAGSTNNNFLGDVAVETLYPSGDGSSSQFLGSDGNSVSNYLLVDEPNVPILTDYVEDAVSGHRDLYAIGNLVRSSGPVYGVQVTDHVRNSDSGAISAKTALKSGAVVANGPDFPVTTTWKTTWKMHELDPDGAIPWTIAKVNAVEAGVEVV
jgi:hypothetical protein